MASGFRVKNQNLEFGAINLKLETPNLKLLFVCSTT